MTKFQSVVLLSLALVSALTLAEASNPSNAVSVDCSKGQLLSQALATLDKHTPTTVSVNGTCTEYVQVVGFENLTLKGLPGATLVEPSTGAGTLFTAVLFIESSQSVTVNGLNVQATTTSGASAIGIGHGSSDIRLRYLSVTGGSEGIAVFENSQASIAFVKGNAPSYTTLGIYDSSDVHLEHSEFAGSTGAVYNVGVALGAAHVTMYDTTISNMQVGIAAGENSIVDILYFNTYYSNNGSTDVSILSAAGTNYNGVAIDAGGSLNAVGARLLISNAGQSSGGTTGGVLLSDGATMNASNGNLLITGSHGQGVIAMNNAHATLTGATVTGSAHGGLVSVNMSSIDVSSSALSTVSGNSVDVFCDTNSWITGSANITGTPTQQCTNLLAAETVTLP